MPVWRLRVGQSGGGKSNPAGLRPSLQAPPLARVLRLGDWKASWRADRCHDVSRSGTTARMRPSIGDEDMLRRLVWCAMPELCMEGRQIAHQDARFGLVVRDSGATSSVAFAASDISYPLHNPSYAGAARLAFKRPVRAPEAARRRPKRVQHAKQDDYRRLPSGRDPGGRITR